MGAIKALCARNVRLEEFPNLSINRRSDTILVFTLLNSSFAEFLRFGIPSDRESNRRRYHDGREIIGKSKLLSVGKHTHKYGLIVCFFVCVNYKKNVFYANHKLFSYECITVSKNQGDPLSNQIISKQMLQNVKSLGGN